MWRPDGIKAGFAGTPEHGATFLSHSFLPSPLPGSTKASLKCFSSNGCHSALSETFKNAPQHDSLRHSATAPVSSAPHQMCRNDRKFRPISSPEREEIRRDERVFRQCVCEWVCGRKNRKEWRGMSARPRENEIERQSVKHCWSPNINDIIPLNKLHPNAFSCVFTLSPVYISLFSVIYAALWWLAVSLSCHGQQDATQFQIGEANSLNSVIRSYNYKQPSVRPSLTHLNTHTSTKNCKTSELYKLNKCV